MGGNVNPIILAVSMSDAADYATSRGWRHHITVTPRSPWAARGRTGPVYATPAAADHPDYDEMLKHATLCAFTVDHDRVA